MDKSDDSGLIACKFDRATVDLILRGLARLTIEDALPTYSKLMQHAQTKWNPPVTPQVVMPTGPTPIPQEIGPTSGPPFADPNA